MFISASEIAFGSVATAPSWSLVFPRREPEHPLLVVGADETRHAVFLGEQHRWEIVQASKLDRWTGAVVPNVRLEVGLPFPRDPETYQPGMLRRHAAGIEFCANVLSGHGFTDTQWISLSADDPMEDREPQPLEYYVHFDTWRIVSGSSEKPAVWFICRQGTSEIWPSSD